MFKTDIFELLQFCFVEGDSLYCFSKSSKKYASFTMTNDLSKLKAILDKLKKRVGPDLQIGIFSVKDPKGTNRKDNLFRSKIYMWADFDYKFDQDINKEKLAALEPPPSVIIRTPGGYHVLWVGDQPINYLAEQDDHYKNFIGHIADQGMMMDDQGAPYKLFRLPGFLGSDGKTVISAEFTGNIYNEYKDFTSQVPAVEEYKRLMTGGMAFTGTMKLSYDELLYMMGQCSQLQHFKKTGGNNFDEWSMFSMIMAYAMSCDPDRQDQFRRMYHDCCKQYHRYSEKECDIKITGLMNNYVSKRFNFIPSCDKLKQTTRVVCGEQCAKYPSRDIVNKNAYLRFRIPEGFYEKDSGLYKTMGEEADIKVCDQFVKPIFSVRDDVSGKHFIKMSANKQTVMIPEEIIPNKHDVMKFLSGQHITVFTDSLMVKYLKGCQSQARVIEGTTRTGLVNGNIVQSNDYDIYPVFNEMDDPFLRNYAKRKGEAELYFQTIKALAKTHPMFAIVYSVGLLQFLPHGHPTNLIVRLYGRAGVGKSLLMQYAKSIIGDPLLFPTYRNVTPLKMVDLASKTSFFVLDELISGGVNFEHTANAIFAIHSGNERMSYFQSSRESFHTTMLAAGEQRFLTTSNFNKGLHRRVYELYANVYKDMRQDMIDCIETIRFNYGFIREIREMLKPKMQDIMEKAPAIRDMLMDPEAGNINHRDTIYLMAYALSLAHSMTGTSLETLCAVAGSTQTLSSADREAIVDELVDFCATAFGTVYSMYFEALNKKKRMITKNDMEYELKKNQLDYYPEVDKFIRHVFEWGRVNVTASGKVTSRMGILVKDGIPPPLVALIEYVIDPNIENLSRVMPHKAVVQKRLLDVMDDDDMYAIFRQVCIMLRKRNGSGQIKTLGDDVLDSFLSEIATLEDRRLELVVDNTKEDDNEERRQDGRLDF